MCVVEAKAVHATVLVALLDLLLCSDEPGDQAGDITPDDLNTFEQYDRTLLERIR